MLVQLIAAARLVLRWTAAGLSAWGAVNSPWGTPALADGDPRRCPSCRRPFACPVEWEAEDTAHWRIELRCGECGHRHERVLDNAQAAAFEECLAADADVLERAADRLDAERMATEIDAFILGLEYDLIAPDDFAPGIR